jgi:hypothetical protein
VYPLGAAASRPELDLLIMTHVAAAWEWTIAQRLGVFSGAARCVLYPAARESDRESSSH